MVWPKLVGLARARPSAQACYLSLTTITCQQTVVPAQNLTSSVYILGFKDHSPNVTLHTPELLMLFYSRGPRLIGGVVLFNGGARAQQASANKFPPNASCSFLTLCGSQGQPTCSN